MADQNKVLSFIDEVNKEKKAIADKEAFMNTPTYKKNCLDKCIDNAKTQCLEYIFKDLYKNSIPLDDSYVSSNDSQLEDEMKDFINRQTANRGIEVYMREAIKKGNKSMAGVLESVDRFVRSYFAEEAKDPKSINPKDLNWSMDEEKKAKLRDISAEANLDQVAKYVKKNVTAAVEYEKQQLKEKKETKNALEEELARKEELTSEAAIEKYLHTHGYKGPGNTMYQPGLFEGVMINITSSRNPADSDQMRVCYEAAVGEYTLLNIGKALRNKSYSINETKALAKEYARGKIAVFQ